MDEMERFTLFLTHQTKMMQIHSALVIHCWPLGSNVIKIPLSSTL